MVGMLTGQANGFKDTGPRHMDITWKKLFAIVMAVHTWGAI